MLRHIQISHYLFTQVSPCVWMIVLKGYMCKKCMLFINKLLLVLLGHVDMFIFTFQVAVGRGECLRMSATSSTDTSICETTNIVLFIFQPTLQMLIKGRNISKYLVCKK